MHRLQTVLLYALCFGYALFRGPATKKGTSDPKKVCVIQLAKLGDMVCTTPMFSAIKRTYPSAQVCVIGNSINKEVLGDHPDVDDYCVWNGAIREMAREIRRRGIEYLCITGPSAGALAAAYLAGVPRIVVPVIENGLSPYETRAYKLLRLLAVRIPHCMGHYAPREYLRLLEPLSIVTDDTTKRINYSDAARKNAAEFLRAHHLIEKKFAVISPSAGNKIKNWPADRFARVAEHLVSRDLPVVVIGGPRDKEEVAAMMRVVGTVGNIIDASEKFSIDELKAFIAQALLFVSSDTGPIYIAEAFNIATVDIIGPIDENEQPPVGSRHKIVVAPRQKPQLFVMNARFYDAREARRQVEAVTVPMVIEAIDELLRENRLTI